MRTSVVIPTLGRRASLDRVLEALARQTAPLLSFETIVCVDGAGDLAGVRTPHGGPPVSVLKAAVPGASAARNAGWRAGSGSLVLFVDDDVVPDPDLVAEHVRGHLEDPDLAAGVLGDVRWASELRVTPFMRWLGRGVQFDYAGLADGAEAGWGRFYTANASVKRELLEAVDGFDEHRFPFGYEDLDLAKRMHTRAGFRLRYRQRAGAAHLHAMSLQSWESQVRRIAAAERRFVEIHPDVPAHFYALFSRAAARPPASGRGARLAAIVPRAVPWLGTRVWTSAELSFAQRLAAPFLDAWQRADTAHAPAPAISPGPAPSGPK